MPRLINISEAVSLALHTMALLAQRPKQRFANRELADVLGASSHHLAKVMQRLSRAGLVHSVRGPQGGCQLARPAEDIRLLDVYVAVDGPLEAGGGCLLSEPVCDGRCCVLGDVFQAMHRQIYDYLQTTTLAGLSQGLRLKQRATLPMAHPTPTNKQE